MTLTEQTRQIIGFTWARMLGLGDDAFDSDRERLGVVDDDAAAVTVVRLFGRTAVTGPESALDALRGTSDEELVSERRLLELMLPEHPGARALGASRLLYCEEPAPPTLQEPATVSFDPADVRAVTSRCPADDVAVSGVAEAEWTATLMLDPQSSDGPDAAAASCRQIWHHTLAHLGVLTRPDRRGRGLGGRVAAIAAEEAFVEGLVPQWRVAFENEASLRIAQHLGFSAAGTQTTVILA
ncbi:MAG: GNAT family N-acetyltransferase [Nesterenkonia sp.]|nr:GNAT family N-acetyltransferase [Nesterenkonia sp.]